MGGELYKRYELKKGRTLPKNAIPCSLMDEITGKQVFWIKCERDDKSNKWHFIAFDGMKNKKTGTYELIGEKIQGNPENVNGHILVKHGNDYSYEGLKKYFQNSDIEGIVFHHSGGELMCKIRKKDFGIKRK